MIPKNRALRRESRGYTLIELLIVVAIVALMAFVAAPWFSRISQRNQLRSAAREIQTTLLAARMTAVRNNAPASVRILPAPPEAAHHSVQTWLEGATPRQIAGLEIPKNVRFVSLPPGDRVVFTADGRRTPAGVLHQDIVIEGPVGSALANQITVQAWENGRIGFVPPVSWK
ncbi:MAG TPA: GspH/FimT family pseudopilin [Thermoanaerobaculia bacterium]|nr:GspH/FimT family pseudopilin [Thermoanaerobaculia bacterium]